MIDIPTEKLSVKRFGSSEWVNGRFQKGSETTFEIDASVQPLRGNEVKILPEHARTSESVKIYTSTRLREPDEKNQLAGDEITRDGKIFKIHSVMNYSIGTDIPHFKIIAVKQDDQGAGNAI